MSKKQIRGRGSIPDHWEWSCDFCGKTSNTNSQTTRPPGWFPQGRTTKGAHDFCSEEHQTEYQKRDKVPVDSSPAAPPDASDVPHVPADTSNA